MRKILILSVMALLILGISVTVLAAPDARPAAANQTALAPNNPILDANWLQVPPVVDGDLSDWDGIARYPLNATTASYPPERDRPAPDDLSAWASITWSTGVTDRLFIAAYIVDDNIVRNSRNWYFDDMVEFIFDVDLDGDYTLGDMRITFSPDGLMTNNGGLALGGKSVVLQHEQGWLVEASVPLRDFGGEFLTNAEVGFTWGVQDDDGGGVRDFLVWAGSTYSLPSPDQGTLRFFNGPTREWRTYDTGDGWTGLEDTSISSWKPDINYGTARNLWLRAPGDFKLLMQFALPELQPGEQVLRAQITFDVTEYSVAGSNTVRVYQMLMPWAENEATWNIASNGQAWGSPGANSVGTDRKGAADDIQTVGNEGAYTFDISNMVRNWYEDPDSNFGMLFFSLEGVRRSVTLQPSECGPGCGPVLEILVESPPPGVVQ